MADQTQTVRILDAQGQPYAPSRALALAGGGNIPRDAASYDDPHLAEWNPTLWGGDSGTNFWRDRITSRVRDLVANDGWASGVVTRVLDNAIGAAFRPISKPDYRTLARLTGISAFDAAWAEEFGAAIDAYYRAWADCQGRYCDLSRQQTMAQMCFLGFRHKLVDGDALAQLHWRDDRIGYGRARYATTVQVIDPDRLSNPSNTFDQRTLRGGIRIDVETGEALAYNIRQAHQTDWYTADRALSWVEVPRETAWGRPIIVHDFDREQAGQHRGVGILAPVVRRLKALIKYDGAELDAAILNAIFSAYITSPFDADLVEEALNDGEKLNAYQQMRADFHAAKKLSLGGARIPVLTPGEDIKTVSGGRPVSNFVAFESTVLRNVAAAGGVSAQQVSNNWSDVNYSSARGALLEAWKTLDRRRDNFAVGFASPIRSAVLEEIHEVEDLPLPKGAPDFAEARAAYARAIWMGPARGWIDPTGEREGAVLGMEAGLSTLEQEAAAQGLDYIENLDQRRREKAAFEERGLEPPASWLQTRQPAGNRMQERNPS